MLSKIPQYLIVGSALSLLGGSANAQSTVKVGILHSLSGTMALSEAPVARATQLAIDEINAKGGILGKKIVVVTENGASDNATFAAKANKLLSQDKVSVVFGGWTSASRKAMLPVFEQNKGLLFYPLQFEGNECSPNVIYTGAQPNQQALPSLFWLLLKDRKYIYLVGSDYIYPRTANKIIRRHILQRSGAVVGESYVPLGGKDFSKIIQEIKTKKPVAIISTINGDSNIAFFQQFNAAGLKASDIPVLSMSIGETEISTIGANLMTGHYAAWNYFQSVDSPENQTFIKAYRAKYGANSVISDPMAHGYVGVYLWKAAVEAANSFNPTLVRKAMPEVRLKTTPLGKVEVFPNGGVRQGFYIGQVNAQGQFDVVEHLQGTIPPVVYDPLTFPGKTCP